MHACSVSFCLFYSAVAFRNKLLFPRLFYQYGSQITEQELNEQLTVKINAVEMEFKDNNDVKDLVIERVKEATITDEALQQVMLYIKQGFPKKASQVDSVVKPYWKLKDELSEHEGLLLYKDRIVVPSEMRREVLKQLHGGHLGVERTRKLAQTTVFWPGISSDIINTTETCDKCMQHRPSLPQEPLISDPPPANPFEEVSADLFEYGGFYFLVMVDRLSGWWDIYRYSKATGITADATLEFIEQWCNTAGHGYMMKLRMDGGTQFTSSKTQATLKEWGIFHVVSAPHFPQSNGLAETAVKAAKHLLMSLGKADLGSVYRKAHTAVMNTPRATGASPAVTAFGRPMRTQLPRFIDSVDSVASKNSHSSILKETTPKGKELRQFEVGDLVWIQDHVTKRWSTEAEVVRKDKRNYMVLMDNGKRLWRNRRQLMRRNQVGEETTQDGKKTVCFDSHYDERDFNKKDPPRRSIRDRRPPIRFGCEEEINKI